MKSFPASTSPSEILMASTPARSGIRRSEEHTSELQSGVDLVCRLLLEKKNHLQLPIGGCGRKLGLNKLACVVSCRMMDNVDLHVGHIVLGIQELHAQAGSIANRVDDAH